jgi:putative dimethyl sulfoxide reductase chaperone
MVTKESPAALDSLARATLYIRLAAALSYPSVELIDALRSGRYLAELSQAVAALDDGSSLAPMTEQIGQAIRELKESSIGLAEEYTFLFTRQAPVPPYESSYGRGRTFGRAPGLEEVAGFYAAFGLRVAPGHPDLPDHVGAELEFVGTLHAREAYAREMEIADAVEVCQDARARFVGEHLNSWLPALADRLQSQARLAFYPGVCQFAIALLASESVSVPNAPAGSAWTPMPSVDDDAFDCPTTPASEQAELA